MSSTILGVQVWNLLIDWGEFTVVAKTQIPASYRNGLYPVWFWQDPLWMSALSSVRSAQRGDESRVCHLCEVPAPCPGTTDQRWAESLPSLPKWDIHLQRPGPPEITWWTSESFPGCSGVKNLPAVQEMQVQSLDREDLLEEEMATHSSVLA